MRGAWLVVVTGCWTAPPPIPPGPATALVAPPLAGGRRGPSWHARRCATAMAHVVDLSRDDFVQGGFSDALLDEVRDATTASCVELAWAPELLDCYDQSATTTDMNACQDQMSHEQRDDVARRMMEILTRAVPPPAP